MIDKELDKLIVLMAKYTITPKYEIFKNKELFFSTSSDTEVKGYDFWKESVLDHLEGMFSFVIYDKHKNGIFARDRAGEKPYIIKTKNSS